jgi:hypothetical protein
MASITAISNATPSSAVQATATAKTAPVQDKTASSSQEDTVKISQAAQAKLLHKQGESVSTIASSLGTDVSSIDGYLGIKATTQVAQASTSSTTSTSADTESTSTSPSTAQADSSAQTAAVSATVPIAATAAETAQAVRDQVS